MNYLETLKAAKEARELSNAEIAQLSNIPLATITRIFNGQTPNPTFETIAQIAVALGTSIDELAGLKQEKASSLPTPIATTLDSYAELLREKDERIHDLKKEKRVLAIALGCIVAFVLILLTVDILNGHFGYFRY